MLYIVRFTFLQYKQICKKSRFNNPVMNYLNILNRVQNQILRQLSNCEAICDQACD